MMHRTKSRKVVLNGNQLHMSVYISSTLPDILNVLDHNKDFIIINSKIRQCCTAYLNSNQASCTRPTDINTSIQQDHHQCQHSKLNSASASLKSLINASDQQQNDYCPICENLCSLTIRLLNVRSVINGFIINVKILLLRRLMR